VSEQAKASDELSGAPRRWSFLAILVLIYACHHVDRIILFILIRPIQQQFGLSDSQAGLLSGLAYGVSFGLAALPVGYLIDRVDRRRLLGFAVMIWSGLTALCGTASSFIWLILARMGVAAAEASGAPTSLSLIADLFAPRQRGTAIGVLYSSLALGGLAAALIGGVVVPRFGWRGGFVAAAIPGAVLGLCLIVLMREPARGALDRAARRSRAAGGDSAATGYAAVAGAAPIAVREMFRFAISQRAFIHTITAMVLNVVALGSVGVWLAGFLMRYHGMTLAGAGTILGIAFGPCAAVGSVGSGIASDLLSRKLPHRRLLVPACVVLIVAPALAFALFTSHTRVAIGIVMVCAAALQGALMPGFASALALVPPGMRGSAAAVAQLCTNAIGTGAGPFAVGLLSDAGGGLRPALITVVGVSCVWSGLHYWLAARDYDRGVARLIAEMP
jgi:predicted MFS family arabinose efflux permease